MVNRGTLDPAFSVRIGVPQPNSNSIWHLGEMAYAHCLRLCVRKGVRVRVSQVLPICIKMADA